MALLGTIELGGTKALVGVGSEEGELGEVTQIPTTTPAETMGAAIDFLRDHQPAAVGIAAFGPLQLDPGRDDYGSILATPKPGWEGTDLIGIVSDSLSVPTAVDTDVNGAALAEGRWGAARDVNDHAYITVGTGIGVGVVHGGVVYRGATHVEMGHVPVSIVAGDDFAGSCPFHGSCLEGMASGKAIAERFGLPAADLVGDSRDWAVSLIGSYLGQGLRALAYTFAPRRVVIGGGVSAIPGFFEAVRAGFVAGLGGYMELSDYTDPRFVVPPALGGRSGLLGGLILAGEAR